MFIWQNGEADDFCRYQFSRTSPKVNEEYGVMLFLQKEGRKSCRTSSRIKCRSREKHRSGGVCHYAGFVVAEPATIKGSYCKGKTVGNVWVKRGCEIEEERTVEIFRYVSKWSEKAWHNFYHILVFAIWSKRTTGFGSLGKVNVLVCFPVLLSYCKYGTHEAASLRKEDIVSCLRGFRNPCLS